MANSKFKFQGEERMNRKAFSLISLALVVVLAACAPVATPAPTAVPTAAPKPTDVPKPLDKFQFRLNWTYYGEHAGFIAARDKGFYKEEGLDVEILEGSGSTTVAQLVANNTNPVAYVDA